MYADDLQIYVQIPLDLVMEGIASLFATAQCVSTWARENRLRLNASKTRAIIFETNHAVKNIKSMNLPGIALGNGEMTPFIDEVVSLGLVLESTLSWRPHVNKVTKKVNNALFGLRFIRVFTTQALRKQLGSHHFSLHLLQSSIFGSGLRT